MDWQFTPFAAPLFVGAALMIAISILAISRRGARGSVALFLIGLASAAYQIGYAFEVGSTTVQAVRFWLKVEYLGILCGPVLILILVLAYTGRQRALTPLNVTLLFFIPAVMLIMIWTNDLHGLIWRDIDINISGGFTRTLPERAVWYWLQMPNTYLSILASIILIVRSIRRSSGLYRRQLIAMLAGILITVVTHIVYLTDVVFPGVLFPTGLDINPYMEGLAGVVIAWSILSYQLLDILPIAYESVVASIGEAVIVADSRDRLVDLNPAAAVMLGVTLAETVGKPVATVFPQWDQLQAQAGSQAHRELALQVQGQPRYVDASLTTVSTRDGRTQGRLAVLHDVTERALSTRRLHTLREVEGELTQKLDVRYVARVGVEAALRLCEADVVYIALPDNANFYVVYAAGNHAAAVVGQTLPGDRGIARRVIRNRAPELVLDVANDPDYLAIIPAMRVQMTLPLLSDSGIVGLLALEAAKSERFTPEIFETINLLAARIASAMGNAALYEERDSLVKELETFAHTVAHDLKNPLGVIRTYADFILTSNRQIDDETRSHLATIDRNTRKGVEIIDALLLLSSTRARQDVKIEILDMEHVVELACARLDRQIKSAAATLKKREMWPKAAGYHPWVEEIWVNLINNALKYGGRPPLIELDWDKPSGDVARYWVIDNGRGLNPDEIGKLFQPFSRLEAGKEGHGLGLAIIQRIVERLGGSTGVESKPGKGSRFYFTLPVTLPQASQPPRDKASTVV